MREASSRKDSLMSLIAMLRSVLRLALLGIITCERQEYQWARDPSQPHALGSSTPNPGSMGRFVLESDIPINGADRGRGALGIPNCVDGPAFTFKRAAWASKCFRDLRDLGFRI